MQKKSFLTWKTYKLSTSIFGDFLGQWGEWAKRKTHSLLMAGKCTGASLTYWTIQSPHHVSCLWLCCKFTCSSEFPLSPSFCNKFHFHFMRPTIFTARYGYGKRPWNQIVNRIAITFNFHVTSLKESCLFCTLHFVLMVVKQVVLGNELWMDRKMIMSRSTGIKHEKHI